MEPRPEETDRTPQSLDPVPEVPTDLPGSKIDLDDIPARVAERAPDVLPQPVVGLSFLILAAVLMLIVVSVILLFVAALS